MAQASSARNSREHTKILVEGALCLALSIVLSKLNLFVMPQGGAVDCSLLPVMLFAYRHGVKWGLGAGALSGILRMIFGGYVYNPIQALLDYPLAFACTGLCAIAPKILGFVLAFVCHAFFSILSGVLFFAEYAPEGQNVIIYSIVYNLPYLTLKYVISGILALIIWKSIQKILP